VGFDTGNSHHITCQFEKAALAKNLCREQNARQNDKHATKLDGHSLLDVAESGHHVASQGGDLTPDGGELGLHLGAQGGKLRLHLATEIAKVLLGRDLFGNGIGERIAAASACSCEKPALSRRARASFSVSNGAAATASAAARLGNHRAGC
jgi:hypothetical protein